MVHTVTKHRFVQFLLVDEVLGVEADRACCATELDFATLAGCNEWSVYGEFADMRCRIVTVNQDGLNDRIGRIRGLVHGWLCDLERSQGLYCQVTEYDGGSEDVDFPMFRVGG